jgi:hypothetical protein
LNPLLRRPNLLSGGTRWATRGSTILATGLYVRHSGFRIRAAYVERFDVYRQRRKPLRPGTVGGEQEAPSRESFVGPRDRARGRSDTHAADASFPTQSPRQIAQVLVSSRSVDEFGRSVEVGPIPYLQIAAVRTRHRIRASGGRSSSAADDHAHCDHQPCEAHLILIAT